MKRLRAYFIIVISYIIGSYSLSAQISQKSIPVIEIRVGDRMPDIEMGEVLNNYTGKKRFSEFRGKLLILDFWSTYCSVCMAAFPKMEALQKKFGDSVQIILVNTSESQKDIENRFLKLRLDKKYKIPNLPSIVNAPHLHKLFPHIGVPHHVWIDSQGVVRLAGNGANTHEKKISEFLAGKEISYLRNEYEYSSGRLGVDNSAPIFNQIDKSITNAVKFSSIITAYNDSLSEVGGSRLENQVDSAAQTVRNCYLHQEALDLYNAAFSKLFPKSEMQNDIPIKLSSHRNLLFVSDTLRYTSKIMKAELRTDADYRRNRFNYEQIVPLNMPENKRWQYMLDDLNRYFGNLYGTEGKIENVKMDCYILVCTTPVTKFKTTNEEIQWEESQIVRQGRTMKVFKGVELKTLVGTMAVKVFGQDASTILLDETGYSGRVTTMELPDFEDIKNIEDIRNALKNYGLDIVKATRELKMMVLRENL